MSKHQGTDFDDFLKEEDIYTEVNEMATKRVIAFQIAQEMKQRNISKTKMAEMMNTSRIVVNRLLNPENNSLTLKTLEAAAEALGKRLVISLV
jgi:predicted XRE-type DNA-binding protein